MASKNKENIERSFLPLKEAATYLGIKKSTLYAYCQQRIIKFFKVRNRKIYFLIEDLNNFVLNEENLVKSKSQIENESVQKIRELQGSNNGKKG
jgi:excisionase family DNA binding protein